MSDGTSLERASAAAPMPDQLTSTSSCTPPLADTGDHERLVERVRRLVADFYLMNQGR